MEEDDGYTKMEKILNENPILKDTLYELIKSEAGYVDDPSDPGGKTKYGIAEKREWPKFAKRFKINLNPNNIMNIQLKQVELYYFESRYYRYRLNNIKDRKLYIAIFDQSILIPELINKYLKIALKNQGFNVLINNNNLTDQEVIMINNSNQVLLLNDFLDNCLGYYESLKSQKKYLNGWRNRIKKLR